MASRLIVVGAVILLLNASIMDGFLTTVNFFSPENFATKVETPAKSPQLTIISYLKEINATIPWHNWTFFPRIIVTGSVEIENVAFCCRSIGTTVWINKTMELVTNTANIYTVAHNFELPDNLGPYSWEVFFKATSLDGETTTTQTTTITLQWSAFPETRAPIEIEGPVQVSYEYGTTGNTFTITATDNSEFDLPDQYALYFQGFLVEWKPWPKEDLTVNIDGLPVGTWRYRVEARGGTFSYFITTTHDIQVDVVTGIPGKNSNPEFRYYLRKFFHETYSNPYNLSLKLVVLDGDGLKNVSLLYTFDDIIWYSQEMIETGNADGEYATNLIIEFNFPDYPISLIGNVIKVRYFAEDLLGNSAMTPLFEYEIVWSSTVVDGPVELYDTPDLWYKNGTTGHTITWETKTGGREYQLSHNGYLIERGRWPGKYTINVDGLWIGDHEFKIYVSNGGWGDSDTVVVHVVKELPFGVISDSVTPIRTLDNHSPLVELIAGVGLVTIIITLTVVIRRKYFAN